MGKAKPVDGLEFDTSYRDAAAAILEVRVGELLVHSSDVLELGRIERLHDMRVASRRLRAALEIFAVCFEPAAHKAVLGEVKAIADALGERRDHDVALEFLEGVADSFGFMDSPGIKSLAGALQAEQREANGALEPYVDPERLERLRETIAGMAERARETVA